MGEYAKRKSDGEQVKIGTCSAMYYLRFEDRNKVKALSGNVNPANEDEISFRLPFPDEDAVGIGEYEDYGRGERLNGFHDVELAKYPGTIQCRSESRLLLNVNCYHGEKQIEAGGDIKAVHNQLVPAYVLTRVKRMGNTLLPVIRCEHCGKEWFMDGWQEVLDAIEDGELKARLIEYSKEGV